MFQRVRAAEGPPTEFDIPVALFRRHREKYEPIGEPHSSYRRPVFKPELTKQPRPAATKTPRESSRKTAPKGEKEVTHSE